MPKEEQTPKSIDWFDHTEYNFLSNFSPCRVVYTPPGWGSRRPQFWQYWQFTTTEAAYQAAKTLDLKEFEAIQSAATPRIAKRLGNRCTLRPDWNDIKFDVMRDVLRLKFQQQPFLTWLLETGDAELTEGNTWHDQIWGNCICPTHHDTPGQNALGALLMQVRTELRVGKATHRLE